MSTVYHVNYYLSSKKKNPPLLYSYVTYLYLINYTYSP